MNKPNMLHIQCYIYQQVIDYYKNTNPNAVGPVSSFYAWVDSNKTCAEIKRPVIAHLFSKYFEDEDIEELKSGNGLAYEGYQILLNDKFISEEGVFFAYLESIEQ